MNSRPTRIRSSSPLHGGFTLVELIVVISIIAIVLGLTLPGVSSLWEERKIAEVETKVAGAVKSARAAAMRERKERGLFFMLDGDVQRIFPIEAEPLNVDSKEDANNFVTSQTAIDRFVVLSSEGTAVTLPSPIRVAPRLVVDSTSWSALDINRLDYLVPTTLPQPHRNFFTIIFNSQGRLMTNRDVLIHDKSRQTGLATTDKPVDNSTLMGIVSNSFGTSINFRSVDGLLVYDDATFVEYGDAGLRREYLLSTGQPLYIARMSGKIIRGPSGENR